MKYKKIILFLLVFGGVFWLVFGFNEKGSQVSEETAEVNQKTEQITSTKIIKKSWPINEFEQRISKKPFGIYITPENSPVQPERFGGYHTGVDVEYEEVEDEVAVISICDGEMVLKRWVSGYGGTVVIKCQKDGRDYYVLYGHLKNESITESKEIKMGERIGILGKGKTQETDGERKHLHFSIHKNTLDLRGYVQNKTELENWVDPEKQELFYSSE